MILTLHAHPTQFFQYTGRKLWLLSIPLLRQLFARPMNLAEALTTGLENACWAALILLFPILSIRHTKTVLSDTGLQFFTGSLFRHRMQVCWSACDAFSAEQSLFLRPWRTFRCTAAGALPRRTAALWLSAAQLRQIPYFLRVPMEDETPVRPRIFHRILAAVAQSNTISALLPTVLLLRRVDTLVGVELNTWFPEVPDPRLQLIAWGLPPLIAALTVLLLTGWALVFFNRLLDWFPFRICMEEDRLFIRSGMFTRRIRLFFLHRLRGICIRQSLLMYLFGISTVSALLPGKHAGTRALLLPAATHTQLDQWFRRMGAVLDNARSFRPPRRARPSFFRKDLLGISGSVIVLFFIRDLPFRTLWQWGFLVTTVIFLWHLILSGIAVRQTGIFLEQDTITLCAAVHFTLQTTRIPLQQIAGVQITQHGFQRRRQLCHLHFYVNGLRRRFTVRHLALRDAVRLYKSLPGCR